MRHIGWRISKHTVSLFASIFLLIGCATIDYDPQADQQLTVLSQQINEQLLKWEHQSENPATPVAYDSKFYDKVQADLATLEMRMAASQDPAAAKLSNIFKSLNDQLENMRVIHKQQGHLTTPYLHAERQLLNSQIVTLMTYELSLKKGQNSGGATSTTATATTQKADQASSK